MTSCNPVISLLLYLRSKGWKHSQVIWSSFREMYDYTEELVDDPGPPYSVPTRIKEL
jgi:hypothetical protein